MMPERVPKVMAALKPYPSMQDSGFQWLGEIPAHWQVSLTSAEYLPKFVRNTGMLEKTVLSLSYGHIVVKPPEKLHGLVPESFETYQIVDPGDIIVRTTDLQNDQTSLRVGYSRHRGIITSAYLCLKTRDSFLPEYGYLLLNAYDLLKILYGYGSGLRQSLDFSHIKRMPLPVPPPDEQASIVRFLDYADRQVRACIRTKQKLIKLLEEQKEAIIHDVVTHGLDPNVHFKASGVEWLGEVPEHWAVTKLVRVTARIGDGLHGTPEYTDNSKYHFINGNNLLHGAVIVKDSTKCVTEETFRSHQSPLGETTLLLSINGTIGSVAYYSGEPVVLGKSVAYINCRGRLSRDYLFFFLQSHGVKQFFRCELTGTTIYNLSLESIRRLPVALPPYAEQVAISSKLGLRTKVFDDLIRKELDEIALLREFWTRQIVDIVTGKFDIRDSLEAIPTEIQGPASTMESEELTDEDEQELNATLEEAE